MATVTYLHLQELEAGIFATSLSRTRDGSEGICIRIVTIGEGAAYLFLNRAQATYLANKILDAVWEADEEGAVAAADAAAAEEAEAESAYGHQLDSERGAPSWIEEEIAT